MKTGFKCLATPVRNPGNAAGYFSRICIHPCRMLKRQRDLSMK